MPPKIWFGTENKFAWLPAPATGLTVSHVGYSNSMQYQNGRMGSTRSMQTHKEYSLDIPVQEASGLQGLDMYNKFASGFYGDMDDYPVFFADPMNYDQNLLPTHFAQPGLYRRGWNAIVDDGAKQYTNYASNPSLESNTTGWAAIPGTGGVISSQGRVGPDSSLAYSGQYRWQQTWSTGTSAVSGGLSYSQNTGISLSGSVLYGGSMWVNSVSKQQRLQGTIIFKNVGGTTVGTSSSTAIVAAANTWTQIVVPAIAPPATTTQIEFQVVAVSGTSGTSWGVSNILRADAVMLYAFDEPPYYFDSTSPGAALVGTRSVLYVGRNIPTFGNTPANIYELPRQGIIWNVTHAVGAEPGPGSNVPYALIPIPPGYRLHIGWTGALTGTAEVVVEGWNAPLSKQSTTVMTPLSSSGATRMNTTVDSVDYAKVYVRRTTTAASTLNITSMMAQLWPTTVTPALTGNFIEGKGHRGLKFGDDAISETYAMVDPYRPGGVAHLKGLSTTLIEAQDRG